MKTPLKAEFEVTKIDDTQIEVTFQPTESRYTFVRLEPSGEVSFRGADHGQPGEIDGYFESDVRRLARYLAEQEAQKRWSVR